MLFLLLLVVVLFQYCESAQRAAHCRLRRPEQMPMTHQPFSFRSTIRFLSFLRSLVAIQFDCCSLLAFLLFCWFFFGLFWNVQNYHEIEHFFFFVRLSSSWIHTKSITTSTIWLCLWRFPHTLKLCALMLLLLRLTVHCAWLLPCSYSVYMECTCFHAYTCRMPHHIHRLVDVECGLQLCCVQSTENIDPIGLFGFNVASFCPVCVCVPRHARMPKWNQAESRF